MSTVADQAYDENNNFEAGGSGANSGTSGSTDSSGGDYSYSGSTDDGSSFNESEARAAGEEAKKQGERQLKLLEEIADGVKILGTTTVAVGDKLSGQLQENKQAVAGVESAVKGVDGAVRGVDGAVQRVEGAVRGLEGAINGNNQSGRLDAILTAVSNFGGK